MAEHTKLPVWGTAATAARLMAANWRAGIKVCLLPLLLWVGGGFLSGHIAEATEGEAVRHWAAFALQAALGIATVPILIIPWFRGLLTPANGAGGGIAPYLRCACWLALFYLSLTAISLTFDAMSFLASPAEEMRLWVRVFVPILEALIGFYIFARFGLVLPSLAAGDRISAVRAWQISSGNGLRVAIICIAPLFLVAFFGGIAVSEIRAAFPSGHEALQALVTLTSSSLMVAVELLFWATVLVVFWQAVNTPKASP